MYPDDALFTTFANRIRNMKERMKSIEEFILLINSFTNEGMSSVGSWCLESEYMMIEWDAPYKYHFTSENMFSKFY